MIDGKSQVGLNIKIAQLLTFRVISVDDPTYKRKSHLLLHFMLLVEVEGLLPVDCLEEVEEVLAVSGLFFVDLEGCEDFLGAEVGHSAEMRVELVEPREELLLDCVGLRNNVV